MAQQDNEWEDLAPSGTSTAASSMDGGWEDLSVEAPQPPAAQKPQSAVDYLLGRGTTGIARLGMAGAQATALGPGGAFAMDPIQGLPESTEDVQRMLGLPVPQATRDVPRRYLGTAVEAATDPLGLAMGAGGLGLRTAMNVMSGIGAEGGGDIGGEIQRGLTGETGMTGQILGGLAGGMALGTLPQAGSRYALDVGGDLFNQLKTKYSKAGADPSEVESLIAAGSAKRFIEEAAKAGGKDYSTIISDFRDISQFVTGADAPLMLQASTNPVFKEELIRLAKSDPTKKAQLEAEINRIGQIIDQKAASLFGQRYAPIPASAPLDIRNVRKRINEIDNKINQLSDPFLSAAGKTDTGLAIQNLVEAKKTLIKRELSPQYEALRQEARDAGLKIDGRASRDLYTFVKQNRIQDIFGRGTKVDREVLSILEPTKQTITVNGKQQTQEAFKRMSFDNIDSLKRLVNSELRRVKDPAQAKKLQDFKQMLDETRDTYVPADFNDRLRDLDQQYYERLGVPFGEQGIKDISAKKYAEQVAPTILKNRQAYQDFVDVAGDRGKQIASNAMISAAHDAVIKDGLINNTSLAAFIKKNAEVLEEMPEVRRLLEASLTDNRKLRQSKANLEVQYEQAQKRIADNWFSGTQKEVPSFTQLVDNAFTNPSARSKLLRDISDLSTEAADAVRSNIRAEVVAKARSNPQGGVNFLTDPKNKQVLDVLLGRGYQENLKKVLTLADAVNGADVRRLNLSVDLRKNLDPLNKLFPGLDTQSTVATIRRPIVSGVQKGVILYSKFSQAKATQAYDDTVFSVLTDPKAVAKLAKTADDLDLSFKNPASIKDALNALYEAVPARVYLSLTAPEEDQRPPSRADVMMLQQFMK
jgi:hypothetical protein